MTIRSDIQNKPGKTPDWLACWQYLAQRLAQSGPQTTQADGPNARPLPTVSPPLATVDENLPAFARRLSDFTGAALAQHFLGPHCGLSKEEVTQSRLLNRYHHQRQKDCLALINAAGLDAVAIKGFALAQQIYPDPDLRITGDLDLVIRPKDLPEFLTLFRAENYDFRPLPAKPWGFISQASFQPLASPDGVVNLDLHVAPDCFPAYKSLTTERLFDQADPFEENLPHIRLANRSHGYFLLASNAAKDKFGPFAVKKVLDALLLDAQWQAALDQSEIAHLIHQGQLQRPFKVFQALLNWLRSGRPSSSLSALQRGEFTRAQNDWRQLFSNHPAGLETEASAWAQLRREFLLCTESSVFFSNNARRLRGFFAPGSGLPKI